MRRSAFTTLSDVAKEAGVTAMTVSVVLNGARSATRVSDATRTRIQEAALRLNYRPNAVARGLSRRRMDTIGVLAIIEGNDINYYFLDVLNGILQGARDHGQNTTVFSVPNWDEDEHRFLKFCDGRVDGIIAIAPLFTREFANRMAKHTPMVLIHPNHIQSEDLPYTSPHITTDEEQGMYEATKFLIERGHRDIAHFAAPRYLLGGRLRYEGYCRALKEAGLSVDERRIYEGEFSPHYGRLSAKALLLSGVPLPTAIVCASDAIAYGCQEVLSGAGIKIPDDISLVGFDDSIHAQVMQPQLTTLRQPVRLMGRRALELIMDLVHEKLDTSDRDRELSPDPVPQGVRAGTREVYANELVRRGSVGPPRS